MRTIVVLINGSRAVLSRRSLSVCHADRTQDAWPLRDPRLVDVFEASRVGADADRDHDSSLPDRLTTDSPR
jgi:hypothetical protein